MEIVQKGGEINIAMNEEHVLSIVAEHVRSLRDLASLSFCSKILNECANRELLKRVKLVGSLVASTTTTARKAWKRAVKNLQLSFYQGNGISFHSFDNLRALKLVHIAFETPLWCDIAAGCPALRSLIIYTPFLMPNTAETMAECVKCLGGRLEHLEMYGGGGVAFDGGGESEGGASDGEEERGGDDVLAVRCDNLRTLIDIWFPAGSAKTSIVAPQLTSRTHAVRTSCTRLVPTPPSHGVLVAKQTLYIGISQPVPPSARRATHLTFIIDPFEDRNESLFVGGAKFRDILHTLMESCDAAVETLCIDFQSVCLTGHFDLSWSKLRSLERCASLKELTLKLPRPLPGCGLLLRGWGGYFGAPSLAAFRIFFSTLWSTPVSTDSEEDADLMYEDFLAMQELARDGSMTFERQC